MIATIADYMVRGCEVGLASSITVGPVAVLVIQRTLSKTVRAGVFSGLGVACADTLMAIVAYFFYSMFQPQIEAYSQILRVGGGIFVVVVGICIFVKNPVPQLRRNRMGDLTPWKDLVSMFGFTLANFVVVIPYILAFFAMFGVGTSTGEESLASFVKAGSVISGFFTGAILWWLLLTLIIGFVRKGFKPRHMITINRVAGVIIILLGLVMILSTFIQINQLGIHA